ncbi:heparan-alpha-glucosaminide N-acetyltransferase domain-containing protein [Luteimonas sp. RD2P54]|uniref:Heparan-alpha-glucosaminide N-acetyltransferase domain-containing protein n=1 Tax=Luteimonas endophytica TaxID=3042023 RepID=A0ABT6JEH7_9GAMM|nr:heparan-alpha-glucosaminide N-acetyltransferase domain-containing protein [Luteimonas endophytica]MDH5824593.1 heparan-alpha-glucosaminide N-acetyltransferase domain-containing protein [Luteimonas endophytica]
MPRFASVDALRGLTVAAMLLVNNPGDWGHVYRPLLHAAWHGCTAADLVFPLFLFLVGVSIALGISARAEAGAERPALQRAVLARALRIVALGLLLHLLAWWVLDAPHLRLWGVLQRISVCFLVVGSLALWTGPRAQWWLLGGALAGYAALLAYAGGVEPWSNPASRIDTRLFGPLLYRFDAATGRGHDPEGLLSTLGALATTLIGLRAGAWLRTGRLTRLWAAGAAALALGALGAQALPLNKNLWTPSYVLWTAGWALLALAAAHVLVDRRGWPPLGRRFGSNAIVAYAGSAAMVYLLIAAGWLEPLYRIGFGWLAPLFGPFLPSLAFAVAFVAVWWAVVYAMDRRGWYPRI